MSKNTKYSDFDIDFGRNEVTGDVIVKLEANAIKQSIFNLLMTRKGERPFNPNYGIGVHDFLFENVDELFVPTLNRDIEEHIDAFEPRAVFESVEIDEDMIDNNVLFITINYMILESERSPETRDSLRVGITKIR